jgi:hypothetical protein
VIIGGALGAGAGVFAAALLQSTAFVYPEQGTRTFVSPQLSRGAFAVTVTHIW